MGEVLLSTSQLGSLPNSAASLRKYGNPIEARNYRKLPLINPRLIHLGKGFKRTFKWVGGGGGGVCAREIRKNWNRKSRLKTSYSSAHQNTCCIYWFLIKLGSSL